MVTARMSRRSITIPPSATQSPDQLWPPLRTARSSPVSRAKAITAATSLESTTDDECGPTVDTSNEDLARVVIFRVARLDHASFDLAAKLPNSDHSILHSVALMRVFSLFRSDFIRRRDSSLTRDLTAALC